MKLAPRPARLGRFGVALLAAAATLGLTGCDAARPGAAAVIDSERISVTRVQDFVRDLRAANPELPAAEAPRAALTRIILTELMADVAAARGVTPTEGSVDSFLGEVREQFQSQEEFTRTLAARQATPPSYEREWARGVVAQLELGRRLVAGSDQDEAIGNQRSEAIVKLLQERSKAVAISVNPRYGRWDPQELQVLAPDGNGLSTPEKPTATPTTPGAPEEGESEDEHEEEPSAPPSPSPGG